MSGWVLVKSNLGCGWVQIRVEVQIEVARVVGFGYDFVAVLWWVLVAILWRFYGGFWVRFVSWVFFFYFLFLFYFGGWGLRLWLVVVVVAVAVVRVDELEKLRP